jgi:16S rRNA A1518/A1519 N6-dimethyltransferase RsmA/KsgA/DIM1 with predicted DNA glycosylase/AP lyase activity
MLRETEPFRRLLAVIDLTGKTVIEVGVGTGVLTRMILGRNPKLVLGFEIDPQICQVLDFRLSLRIGDFRRVDGLPTGDDVCLIAAPPYDLLKDLMPLIFGPPSRIADVILMVPSSRLPRFSDFKVEFDLSHTAFDPHTDPGRHYVIRRGFERVVPI